MAEKSPWHCPNCGALLIRKEGRHGPFMACLNYPDCRYTRALWTYDATHVKPYCEKCKGKGKLPWTNKEGKIVSHVWVYCECHEEEPEYPFALRPEDFDFPISYDYYRGLCQLHGWPDPGACAPPEHSKEELLERIKILEEKGQSPEEPEVPKPPKKPKPKLSEGVKL